MIFYGDVSGPTSTRDICDRLSASIDRACAAGPDIDRHAAWVTALIAAGEAAQGLADAALAVSGFDDDSPAERTAMLLAMRLSAIVGRSWDSGFASLPTSPPSRVLTALLALRSRADARDAIEVRRTEGFAHYAVYPEAFWTAASEPGPHPARVIGIRSIGTTLAAVTAVALGAPRPLTIRPLGHPFARETRLGPRLDRALQRGAGLTWGLVDEGPGLSGSSFAAVANALAGRGTPVDRLVLYPSHAHPPGAMAQDANRALWRDAPRRVVATGDLLLDGEPSPRGLAAWVQDLTGPATAPVRDIADGRWRALRYGEERLWPAADRQNERRKYLVEGPAGTFLLKFTGLGDFGRTKHRRAATLAAEGYTIEPVGWRHGFLVEPWRSDAAPMSRQPRDRAAFLDHLGRYLGFRASLFGAASNEGATLEVLLGMARINAAERLGPGAASALDGWTGRLGHLSAAARPVAIDGRLHAHEWLVDAHGRWLKTDALDHCCGHDLIGCQDIAWDIAGAAVEFGLSRHEVERLRRGVERESRHGCDPELIAFFRIAYAAFQVGALTMARDRESGPEARRLVQRLGEATVGLRAALNDAGP